MWGRGVGATAVRARSPMGPGGSGDGSRLAQVGRRREEQLEQVREETDSEGLAHGARSEVGEAREERERTQPIRRREEDLKEDGQLLGWRVLSGGSAT